APDEGKTAGEESMLGRVDSGLASGRSRLGLISEENEQYEGITEANAWATASSIAKVASGVSHALSAIAEPTGAPHRFFLGLGNTASATGDAFSAVSQGWRFNADRQGMIASHLRRRDEWAFQSNQTLKEMQQIDKQILANQIRIDITNKELNNHIEQTEQSKAVDEVMRSKFSNEQLYEWMKTELSKLYFSAYRMALDMARKAERAAARELGVKPLNILGNAYWDSLRDGLLAGERLHQDLKRLEVTYLDQNRREYELTKHISLRRLDPKALVKLRAKDPAGRCRCEFDIPEWLFDLDTPGHYLRRIKSVSVSIPSVTGPYTSVSCKLTLLKSKVRHERNLKESNRYLRVDEPDDDRFTDYFGASEAIVTSTGTGDSGLFETNLRDERFLPFEGSGVISEWRLELPDTYPQFDYSTISDVVLSIRYTAREGGDLLRNAATTSIGTLLDPAVPPGPDLLFPVVLNCRSDFPTEWARAKTSVPGGVGPSLVVPITRNLLPYWMNAIRVGTGAQMVKLTVQKVEVIDFLRDQTAPPSFAPLWQRTPGSKWPSDADEKGEGTCDLGTLPPAVTDRVVLLSIGK
ncbi:MAG: Tc toxin subunit A-related protein, partial [Thiobacillus sp.]